jgi:carbonic anhydrase
MNNYSDSSSNIQELFENNKRWVAKVMESDADFFARLTKQQSPKFLWIGCSDSRVPANQITGLAPGEVFVHRNIANIVSHTDLNALSVIQFAVDVLKVEHVIVCGHYGCGGVLAALSKQKIGLADAWINNIKDIVNLHSKYLGTVHADKKHDMLCELNVIEQVRSVCYTNIIQDAWTRGQNVSVHGIIYGIQDGLLSDLSIHAHNEESFVDKYEQCMQKYNTNNNII